MIKLKYTNKQLKKTKSSNKLSKRKASRSFKSKEAKDNNYERRNLNARSSSSHKADDASNYDNLTINSQTGSTLTELIVPLRNVNMSSNSIDYIDKVNSNSKSNSNSNSN